ncbi:hypothetical protein GOAMR_34_00900 [Gordonia amarae NBRC 15530]|uniref:FHA domain-containing protein n=1 Tax=Gordonia amarae NBRC 15530 TaxID=1075090 RepID=G7GP98_9ACTN|nr:hypothetical protein GOAMR_34_00900 [Gordonia amarae NBRC 15530]
MTLVPGDGVVIRKPAFFCVVAAGVSDEMLAAIADIESVVETPDGVTRRGRHLVRAIAQLVATADDEIDIAFAATDRVGVAAFLNGQVFAEADGRRIEPEPGVPFDRALPWAHEGFGLYLAGVKPAEPGRERFDLVQGMVPAGGALLHVPVGLRSTQIVPDTGEQARLRAAADSGPALSQSVAATATPEAQARPSTGDLPATAPLAATETPSPAAAPPAADEVQPGTEPWQPDKLAGTEPWSPDDLAATEPLPEDVPKSAESAGAEHARSGDDPVPPTDDLRSVSSDPPAAPAKSAPAQSGSRAPITSIPSPPVRRPSGDAPSPQAPAHNPVAQNPAAQGPVAQNPVAQNVAAPPPNSPAPPVPGRPGVPAPPPAPPQAPPRGLATPGRAAPTQFDEAYLQPGPPAPGVPVPGAPVPGVSGPGHPSDGFDAVTDVAHSRPMAYGIRCPQGHLNHPEARWCAECRQPLALGPGVLVKGERPPLGRLILDQGTEVLLDETLVLGRLTGAGPTPQQQGAPRLIQVRDDSGLLSRKHVEFRLVEWTVQILDLHSANGTYVSTPNTVEIRLAPGRPHILVPGSRIRAGGRTVMFESAYVKA